MPSFSPSVNSTNPHKVDQGPGSWSSIFDSLSNNLQDIARKLLSATRNQTPPPGRQIQAAPDQEVNNQGSPTAAAPTAAAPNAAAPAGVPGRLTATDAAKNWLSTECDNLLRDLSSRNANGNPPNTLETRTGNLYTLARDFKNQIGNHQQGLRAMWPRSLLADFDANIRYIENKFNEAGAANTSLAEVDFLKSYFSFMKSCLSESSPDLSRKLGEVEKQLTLLKKDLSKEIESKKSELKKAQAKIDLEQHRQLPQANLTDEQQAERTRLEQEARDAPETVDEANVAVERLTRQINQLENGPIDLNVQALRNRVVVAETQVTTANRTVQESRQNGSNAIDQVRVEAILTDRERALADRRTELQQAETEQRATAEQLTTQTINLLKNTQKLEAIRLGAATAANIQADQGSADLVVNQLSKNFKEAQLLASRGKNITLECAADSLYAKNQLSKLEADPNHRFTIDQKLRNGFNGNRLNLETLNIQINGADVYTHALNAIGANDDPQDNQNSLQRNYTPREKKLALIILGSCAAQQAAIHTDNHGDTFKRTNLIASNAARLLAASLVGKTPRNQQNDQPRPNPKANIRELIVPICEFDTEKAQSLNAKLVNLPSNIPEQEYAELFTNEVSLLASAAFKNAGSDVQSLIKLAKTDRTFEKDRTAGFTLKEGNSRQKVLKESLVRAAALLSPTPVAGVDESLPSADKSRIRNAKDTPMAANDVILERLGLSAEPNVEGMSEELLDQLTMAAVAQNDLSLKEGHQHRGSMQNKIERHDKNPTVETLKNHNLNDFGDLNKKLIDTAVLMRPRVDEAIRRTSTALERNKPVKPENLQRLIKQIIITTDAKSALNTQFNLKELTEAANNLSADNTAMNRARMKDALDNTRAAWRDGEAENNTNAPQNPPDVERWNTEDSRSFTRKILSTNPIRSLPFLNRTPGLGRLCNASFKLGKSLLAVAGIPVAVTLAAPFAIAGAIGLGIYKTHKAVNR